MRRKKIEENGGSEKENVSGNNRQSGWDLHGEVYPLILSHSLALFSDRLTEVQEVNTARKNKSTRSSLGEKAEKEAGKTRGVRSGGRGRL